MKAPKNAANMTVSGEATEVMAPLFPVAPAVVFPAAVGAGVCDDMTVWIPEDVEEVERDWLWLWLWLWLGTKEVELDEAEGTEELLLLLLLDEPAAAFP